MPAVAKDILDADRDSRQLPQPLAPVTPLLQLFGTPERLIRIDLEKRTDLAVVLPGSIHVVGHDLPSSHVAGDEPLTELPGTKLRKGRHGAGRR